LTKNCRLLQALCLRQLSLKLIPAQGVIIEPLGVFDQNADGTYQLSDLAWGAESWLAVRLHISPNGCRPKP
jgi:Ca-activated chloride channel family protein